MQAQLLLGICYYKGEGVTKDYKEAVKWWTKSLQQGNAKARLFFENLKSE